MKLTTNSKQHLMTESTVLSLDDIIAYGNPTVEQIQIMSKSNYLDGLYDELSEIHPPSNSSEVTQKELNDLLLYTAKLDSDTENKNRFLQYDTSIVAYLLSAASNVGFESNELEYIESLIHSILEDTDSLLMNLKFNFNRARPYQLSFYYKMQLFPFETANSNTPSYPSGHSFQAKLITEVLGNRYPKYYHSFKQLSDDISMSRLYLGVHYQSDIDMGLYAAEVVLDNKSFKEKYGL
jgi:hypothetical protein